MAQLQEFIVQELKQYQEVREKLDRIQAQTDQTERELKEREKVLKVLLNKFDCTQTYLVAKQVKEKERAQLQFHHDSSFPRPCGDVRSGLILWIFNPKRTKAREDILRVNEDLNKLANEYTRCINSVLLSKKVKESRGSIEDEEVAQLSSFSKSKSRLK